MKNAIIKNYRITPNGAYVIAQLPDGTFVECFLMEAPTSSLQGCFLVLDRLTPTPHPVMVIQSPGGEPVWENPTHKE